MVTWWRRSKISPVFHSSSRRDSRSHVITRVISRKTNRRHMIGDRYDPTAERATLLVRTVDGILGTHTVCGFRMEREKACRDTAPGFSGRGDRESPGAEALRPGRQSTVARRAGGPARSSGDALVMGAERRGRVARGLG